MVKRVRSEDLTQRLRVGFAYGRLRLSKGTYRSELRTQTRVSTQTGQQL